MADSALLKVDRATRHVNELNEFLSKTRPFSYIIETDTDTRERSAYPKRDEAIAAAMALTIGDAVHNLRSALDHAFWEIVYDRQRIARGIWDRGGQPSLDREARRVQFPFTTKAANLDGEIKQRMAEHVGTKFCNTLRGLKPYREAGGNQMLYLIHKLDVLDKHRLLIPTGDYTRGLTTMIRQLVPDFPYGLDHISFFHTSFGPWRLHDNLLQPELGAPVGGTNKFQREIQIPIDIVLELRAGLPLQPIIPLLHTLVDTARETIRLMRDGAAP
jgi:hypothetical protein